MIRNVNERFIEGTIMMNILNISTSILCIYSEMFFALSMEARSLRPDYHKEKNKNGFTHFKTTVI